MYIVYETNNAINTLRSKYLVLELDTIEFSDGKTVKAFAIVDNASIPFQEISQLDNLSELHSELIKNYHLQNWNYCSQAIFHLIGKFKGEMDSFYEEIANRIAILKTATIADDWTGNILTFETIQSE